MNQDRPEFDAKSIAHHQSIRKGWKRNRWNCLLAGVLLILTGVWLLYQLALTTEAWGGWVVWLCPSFSVMLFVGLALCTRTLVNWHGDPVITLVLQILDRHQSQIENPELGNESKPPKTET